jgi:hypothetical protein
MLAIILALIFILRRVGSSSDQLATPPNGGWSSAPTAQVAAISSPHPSTSPSHIRIDSPTRAPVEKPSNPPDEAPTVSPRTTRKPSLRPTPAPLETSNPVLTAAPTFFELRVDTQKPTIQTVPTGGLSLTAAPTEHDIQAFDAKSHLMEISGDLLNDPTTPQHAAYQWLVNEDPANLDLDLLPIKTLEQRYIAALLYFSTIGSQWENTFNFLTDTDVCEWKDNRTSHGILCDTEDTVKEITISK